MAGNSSIGTAWIQIKPSLKGITNDLKRELASAETEAQNSSNKVRGIFSGVFNGLGGNIVSTFSAAFSKVGGIVKTTLTASFASVSGLLTSSIGGAVSRIDTLNNAPRVFEALGYSTESVSASMDDLNGYLNGLPTTLDSAVSQVQLLSSAFGGIENGTKYFKALNDAGLAFGATTDQIENGIVQLSQLSLDGPIDAATWNSLRNSGFGPVFAAMADQAGITVGKLKEDFGGDGTKTVQDFLDSLMELDEKGNETMSSLAEMARANTDGIATSFKNAKTAVSRGMGEIVKGIPNLASNVVLAGKSIEGVLKGTMGVDEATNNINTLLTDIVRTIVDTIGKVAPLIIKVLPNLITTVVDSLVAYLSDTENVNVLIDGFVKLFVAVAAGAGRIVTAIIPLLPSIVGQIVGSFATEFGKPENAGPIIGGLSLLFGGVVLKTVSTKIASNLKSKIGGAFSNFFKNHLGKKTASEAGSAVEKVGSSLSSKITSIGSTISSAFKSLGSILASVVNAVLEPIKVVFKGVAEAVAGFFKAFADPMIAVGAAMFTVAAAAIAAAIFLIGSAIGAVMPTVTALFNDVLMPLANFIVDTVLLVVATLTELLINLTNSALIPLGEFMTVSFIAVVDSVANALIRLTQGAVIPLLETLSGSFSEILHSVADLITGVLQTALDGIAKVIEKVSEGFKAMGEAIRNALDGVNGILETFKDLILGIADAVVAVVALTTGHSINYGPGFAHITKAATGGRVEGIGTDTSDSNLYALSKGEYVIRAAAARQIGYDNLDTLNKSGSILGGNVFNITIEGYDKDPEELANIVSRKIALKTAGVY